MEKIVLAGACSVFGLEEIAGVFADLGFEAEFAEATFMKPYLPGFGSKCKNISFTDSVEDLPVVPLSEYWISRCIKGRNCKIAPNVLKASRDKLFFNQLLQNAGMPCTEIYQTQAQALAAVKNGETVLIKPAGANSGYGTAVVNFRNIQDFDRLFAEAGAIKNKILSLMQVEKSEVLLCRYISGTEYSADCFLCGGRAKIVRLCRKSVLTINSKPCTATVQLAEPDARMKDAIENWLNLLFAKEDLSFAQFDFIKNSKGELVPIDFACRVGGGMAELLCECEQNPYAAAVSAVASAGTFGSLAASPACACESSAVCTTVNIEENKKPITLLDKLEIFSSCRICEPGKNWQMQEGCFLTMLNYLPVKSGYIVNDAFAFPSGKVTVHKKKGSFVTGNPSSVASKIAAVICQHPPVFTSEELQQLLIAEPFIQKEKQRSV